MSEEKVSRRGYAKYAAAGVVIVGVAAAGAYYATRPPAPTPTPTPTPTTPGPTTPKPTPTPTKPPEKVELNFYTTGHSGFFYDVGRLGWKPVARYMEANPNIKINTFVDAYFDVYTKEASTFAAGTYAWDAAYTHGALIREFHKFLTPLKEMGVEISKEVQEDIIPYPRYAVYNDKLDIWYGLPRMFEIFTLMGDADILDAKGLEFPRSFEEMIECFKAVHDPKRGKYAFQVGLKEGYLIPPFLCFLHANGGDHVDWNDPRQIMLTDSEETVKAVKDMMYVYDNFMDPASIEKIAFVESCVDWFNGHMVFGLFYPWPTLAVVEPDSKVKSCYTWLWPGHKGVVRAASEVANEGYAIPKMAKYKKEAWDFIQYLNSREVDVQKMLNMGYKQENEEPLACRWSYLEDERIYEYPYNLVTRASLAQSKYNANRYEYRPYFHALNAAVEAAVVAALTKAEKPEDSLKAGRERTDKAVAEEYEKFGPDYLGPNAAKEMQKYTGRIDALLKKIPVEERYLLPE